MLRKKPDISKWITRGKIKNKTKQKKKKQKKKKKEPHMIITDPNEEVENTNGTNQAWDLIFVKQP